MFYKFTFMRSVKKATLATSMNWYELNLPFLTQLLLGIRN